MKSEKGRVKSDKLRVRSEKRKVGRDCDGECVEG